MNKYISVLKNHFPKLYSNISSLECNEGWNQLIYDLSDEITNYCILENIEMPHFLQIKEKFAGLRCYLSSYTEDLYNIIKKYEEKSYTVCEICGNTGYCNEVGYYIQTLCEHCYKEKFKELQ